MTAVLQSGRACLRKRVGHSHNPISCHTENTRNINYRFPFQIYQLETYPNKMMKTLVSFLLLIAPIVTASGNSLRGSEDNAIFCHLFVASGSEAEEHGDETLIKYQCLFDDDESRRKHHIDLSESFLKEHQSLIMQNPILRIPGGVVTKHSVYVPANADVTVHAETSPRRRLAPKNGKPRALSVRVIANGNAGPRESEDEIKGRVFGVGPDAQDNTVFTQYKKCSFGAQDIQPATEGNGVVN
jgi:hypothetical protein